MTLPVVTPEAPSRGIRRSAQILSVAAAVIAAVAGCGEGSDRQPPPVLPHGQTALPSAVTAAPAPGGPDAIIIRDQTIPLVPVKTTLSGALLPPVDVSLLGWWVDSALPGQGGTTVIAGHINDVAQGQGVASSFAHLVVGEKVTLTGAHGNSWDYRITAVRSYDKRGSLPVEELNRLDGPRRLALVTCGGAFIGGPLGYQDNDIAWAEPG